MKRLFDPVVARICLMLLLAACMVSCSKDQHKMYFDIPEGDAKQTLKEFAHQAEVEILFDLQIVDNVRTKAVSGSYRPDAALGMMIKETNLAYHVELETGAFAVALKEFPHTKSTARE